VRGREIGIDVERIHTNFDYEDIAERFFSPSEIAALRTISADSKPKAFFDCWTRKEAYIKAQGDGLSLPLYSFDVSFAPDGPARFLAIRKNKQKASNWTLHELTPGNGYVGALAVEGCDWKYKYWQWAEK
jgi:4'-phosphopantetheinyl transferase